MTQLHRQLDGSISVWVDNRFVGYVMIPPIVPTPSPRMDILFDFLEKAHGSNGVRHAPVRDGENVRYGGKTFTPRTLENAVSRYAGDKNPLFRAFKELRASAYA